MIVPFIAAAVAVAAVGSLIKDIGSSSAKEDQLRANDNALRIAEDHNAAQAQQARLAVMGGAFSGGSFDNYINQQLFFANADLAAKRQNIAAEKRAIRANEIGTAVGIVGKAMLSYASATSALSMLKQSSASAAALGHIRSDLDTIVGPRSIPFDLESSMHEAGEGMVAYMNKGESLGFRAIKGLGVLGPPLVVDSPL